MLSHALSSSSPHEPDPVAVVGRALHSSRNLLMAMRGYADMILRSGDDVQRNEEWARKIVCQLDRLSDLHSRVSILSDHKESGLETLCLPMLLGPAEARARERVGASAQRVDVHTEVEETVVLLGNTERLLLALTALLENALEATPDNGRVWVELVSDEVHGWQLRIHDGGPGFGGDDVDALSTPFQTTKQGHLGLGLYLSRLILSRHGLSLRLGNGPTGEGVATIHPKKTNEGGLR